ncbi:GTP 3',8-cyclase MoaA [Parvibium lacunae]|uniref:GTP 3',8-cyclase n=2 Tax=Parvibium lacunae TaxID=1888893 RepID=A0A368L708_9BURK|nr:GTP 3',8-cyclase MoaA [Parvibium lacunae]RCS59407.1 GTP 3',8-cyclase MoaA [Parvibium lacunae]
MPINPFSLSATSPTTVQAGLIDPFGRKIDYLRVSVTDRCDLRCHYCLPKRFRDFSEPENWLTLDEQLQVIQAFSELGVKRVRLTGGEPLLRKNLTEFVHGIAALPLIEDISLSTNGTQLAKHAHALKAAGLHRLNISLDSLERRCMADITGSDSLPAVMAGIAAAQEAGFRQIKINMVALANLEISDYEKMVDYCFNQGLTLRMIETMPIGQTGQQTPYINLQSIQNQLVQRYQLEPAAQELGGGPARYWQTQDGKRFIGFITPISQHFCATCNRLRLSVEGNLHLCLGQNDRVPLRALIRQGLSLDELKDQLLNAIAKKPEKHDFTQQPHKIVRFMASTGG